MRKTLPAADAYLAAGAMTLQWRADANFALDVAEFEAAIQATGNAATDDDGPYWLETAVTIYMGDLLPGN